MVQDLYFLLFAFELLLILLLCLNSKIIYPPELKYLVIIFLLTPISADLKAQDRPDFWEKTNAQFEYPNVGALAVSIDNKVLAASGAVYYSTDKGITWTKAGFSPGQLLHVKPNGLIFGGTHYSGVMISLNHGVNWYPTGYFTSTMLRGICSDNLGYVYAGAVSGLYGTTNNGNIWWPIPFPYSGGVISVSANSQGHIFACSGDKVLYRSSDNAHTWTKLDNGLPVVDVIALGEDSSHILFACTGGYPGGEGIFRSSDNGDSWSQKNNGLGNLWVNCIAINKLNEIYVGTNAGVYYSNDLGENWSVKHDPALDTLLVTTLVFDKDGYLFAGTYGYGIYRSKYTTTTVDDNNFNAADEFFLGNNYPNPFNPSTTMEYSISSYSSVTIKIFDVLGNEIEMLVNDEKPAGNYKYTWNAKGLPSGVYFCRMQTEGHVQIRKMILMR